MTGEASPRIAGESFGPSGLGGPRDSLVEALGADAARLLLDRVETVRVPGGEVIFHEGDAADAFYVVASGMIGISASDGHGGVRRLARVGPPEILGEVGLLLTEAPRSATAMALRDCLLLRCSRASFDEVVSRSPEALLCLARLMARRLASAHVPAEARGAAPHGATVAIVAVTEGVDASGLARAIASMTRGSVVLDREPEGCDEALLHRVEAAHRSVIYASEGGAGAWGRLCLRRADRVLLLAGAGRPFKTGVDEALKGSLASPWTRWDLVVLQEPDARRPRPCHPEIAARAPGIVCHLRPDDPAGVARLARLVTGRALGLVLSGGGARGFAHVGALRALEEAGVAVDLVGGTSIGAVVGAALALGWSLDEVQDRVVDAFVASPPLDDYTLPLVALTRGLKVEGALSRHFGDARIEDLWRPFFCVSTNLSAGAGLVHRDGPLVPALRASIAIPGLLPPVVTPLGVLVDGAMVDNLPVGAMADLDRAGFVLAIDVAGDAAFVSPRQRGWRARGLRRWFGVPHEMPGIVEILLRAATVSSDAQAGLARARASVVIRPPLAGVDLRAWRSFEAVARIGYDHTRRLIEAGLLDGLAAGEAPRSGG